jgi:hypothetical protein
VGFEAGRLLEAAGHHVAAHDLGSRELQPAANLPLPALRCSPRGLPAARNITHAQH